MHFIQKLLFNETHLMVIKAYVQVSKLSSELIGGLRYPSQC